MDNPITIHLSNKVLMLELDNFEPHGRSMVVEDIIVNDNMSNFNMVIISNVDSDNKSTDRVITLEDFINGSIVPIDKDVKKLVFKLFVQDADISTSVDLKYSFDKF